MFSWNTKPLPLELIDKGVNFFVLKLEELGARTFFSCEGHPNGFYIMFQAPASVALSVYECGFFNVELAGKNYWRLCVSRNVREEERKRILQWAADSWVQAFGPITHVETKRVPQRKKQKVT